MALIDLTKIGPAAVDELTEKLKDNAIVVDVDVTVGTTSVKGTLKVSLEALQKQQA